MDRRVEWSDKALDAFKDIILYYKLKDSRQAALNFQSLVFKKIEQLKEQPLIGAKSPKFKTVRKIQIDGHRQMAYRVHGKTIYISNFWDTRRNPNDKPF